MRWWCNGEASEGIKNRQLELLKRLRISGSKKPVLFIFLVCLVLCIGIFAVLNPETFLESLNNIAPSATVEIFSAILIILIVYFGYVKLIGVNREAQEVRVIRPGDINGEIRSLPIETSYYYLWGRSATYFRSETLRALDNYSKENRITVEVNVLLPDPLIEELCNAYDDMMAAVGEARGQNKLLKNAIATATICAIISANNRNIRVNLFFSKFLPAFRVDISEQGAILTEDDKKLYALAFSRGSQFFEMFRSMIENEKEISRRASWDASKFRGYSLEQGAVSFDLMDSFGFDSTFISEHQDEISALIQKRDHRYK